MITLLLWAGNLVAQNYLDVIRPFQGMDGKAGAESGMVPAAMVESNALLGNPALLSYSEKAYLAFDISIDQVAGTSVFNSTIWEKPQEQGLNFNSLTYIYPVHVYRGAWVWGVSLQSVKSFSSISEFGDFDPDDDFYYQYHNQETGALSALTVGSSFLVTMNTSLGFAVNYLRGENSMIKVYQETDPHDIYTFDRFVDSLHFTPQYSGFGARFGLLSELTETLNLGISVEFPSRISVSESSGRDSIEWLDWDTSGMPYYPLKKIIIAHETFSALEYTVWGPWRLGLGLGFVAAPLEASVNYRFHTYRTTALKGDILDPLSGNNLEAIIDEQISDNIQNVHEFSASLLWSLHPLELSFAASFMNDPLNYHLDNIVRMDLGVGYQLRSGLGFTWALRNEQWQSDLNHTLGSGVKRTVEVENNFSKLQFGIKYIL